MNGTMLKILKMKPPSLALYYLSIRIPRKCLGLTKYRGLWQIEAAFRLNKHDLRMRPIYHWTPERIVAHIAICFLAFTVAKQAMYRLNVQQKLKLSFEQIRSVLLSAQASVLVDINTKKRYLLPSKVTVTKKKIYQCFGLKRVDTPSDIN